ncbi:hypothetical protein HOI18_04835 [Candidatus Uhrbacteria bacterium]|nr:hypothetical protein [Candidatus Uhrbacteria bacterium]
MCNKLRGYAAAAAFLIGLVLFAAPDLLIRRFWNWGFNAPPKTRRSTETLWQFRWAERFMYVTAFIMGMNLRFKYEGDCVATEPHIILYLHRTTMDPLLAAKVIQDCRLGHTLWIVKEEMRKVFGFGGVLERSGYAFVFRAKKTVDTLRILAMTRLAKEDGANVAFFPEGKRHDGIVKDGARFWNVGNPKMGGFKMICNALPDYPIMIVCLDWGKMEGGKTILDGDAMIGRTVQVTAWQEENPGADGAGEFLEGVWTKMDEMIEDRSKGTDPSTQDVLAQV